MFVEKRGGATTSWTPAMSTLPFQSLPLEPSSDALGHSYTAVARRKSCPAVHPNETKTDSHSDSSLTSLGWLQNLKVLDMFSPEVRVMFHPPSPCSEDGCSWETVSGSSASPCCKNDPFLSGGDDACPLSPFHQCLMHSAQFKMAPKHYRSDSSKPPYSYTSLIFLAIQHSRSGKSSLHDICRWIKTNFKFFKEAEPGWQSSIRQNLTQNELFVKVPRSNGESSRGCCWTVQSQYREFLERGSGDRVNQLAKGGRKLKRAYSYNGNGRQLSGARKRVKSETQLPVDPCGLPGDLDWISLLSSQRVSCGSCPSQACRPVYGSPILGPPDLGQVGDPMICSPLVVPATIANSPTIPAVADTDSLKIKELEEDVFTNHTSPLPSPHLLPWADSRPESPHLHPWAESKETTLKNLGRQTRPSLPLNRTGHAIWSPEISYTSSCSIPTSSLSCKHKRRPAESYIY